MSAIDTVSALSPSPSDDATQLKTTSSGATASRNFYLNTLVFTLIAGFITVVLLALIMFLPEARTFMYFIILVELGLIGIIIAAVVRIYLYERNQRKEAERGNDYLVGLDTCPDYFANTSNEQGVPEDGKLVNFRSQHLDAMPFCTDNGADGISCSATRNEKFERFILAPVPNADPSVITLRGPRNNMFCGVDPTDGLITCDKPAATTDATKFRVTKDSSGALTKAVLRSFGDNKVCSFSGDKLKCNGTTSAAGSRDSLVWSESSPTVEEMKKRGVRCSNGYLSPDGQRRYYFVKRGCVNDNDPNYNTCLLDPNRKNTEFTLDLDGYNNTSASTLCKRVNTNDATVPMAHIPWTDVKAKCNSLSLGLALSDN